MLPHIALAIWFRSSFDKLTALGVILYALRHKQNVAAKYGNGTFELIATGDNAPKKLK
jgi:hypothetical protein